MERSHTELVERLAPIIGVVRYVQHHPIVPEAAEEMSHGRGLQDPFDAVAEIAIENFEALERGNLDPATAEAQVPLTADELKFIHLSRSAILFTHAKIVIA